MNKSGNVKGISKVSLQFQKGLSLIELMVAMVIGLILVAGVIEIYVNSKQTYRNQDALSRLQENGRYALSTLVTKIRPAGFAGCGSLEAVETNVIADPPVPSTFNKFTAVTGYENNGGQSWDATLPPELGAVVDDTDVITLARTGDCGATLAGNLEPNNANIQVDADNTCDFKQDDVLMISDCEKADVFRIVNTVSGTKIQTVTHSQGSNNANTLSKLYQEDAEILDFSSETYFIRNGASGVPALWVLDGTQAAGAGNNPLELVEGVENLQVQYGIDDGFDSVPDRYVDADVAKANWDKVVAVRIQLLLRTIENVQAAQYTFNDVNYSGGFLRQELQATVKLRNRGLL